MLVVVWHPFKIWNWEVMSMVLLVKNLYVEVFKKCFFFTISRPGPFLGEVSAGKVFGENVGTGSNSNRKAV